MQTLLLLFFIFILSFIGYANVVAAKTKPKEKIHNLLTHYGQV